MPEPELTDQELFKLWTSEFDRPFSGWDFSYLSDTERLVMSPLPWSYASEVLDYIRLIDSLLDLGTGGGELLSQLSPLPKTTVATEAYPPNVAIARERLAPLGVRVVPTREGDALPFENGRFDLVISRHESYQPEEVLRVLAPSGHFITPQVGAQNDRELERMMGGSGEWEFSFWDMAFASKQLLEAGFQIVEQREAFPQTRIFDVGALVYYLKTNPWGFPDFSVEPNFNRLLSVHSRIHSEGYLEVKSHRFFIIARKPDG